MVDTPAPRNAFPGSLLAKVRDVKAGTGTRDIPLDQIEPDPDQPRRTFDQAALAELAETIRRYGVLQAIVVKRGAEKPWRIVHGERRWRASMLAGRTTIPAIERVGEGGDQFVRQVVENQHREGLTNREIGAAVACLTGDGARNAEIATIIGRPEHQLKLFRAIPDVPPSMVGWIDKLDMRTVYELTLAWQKASDGARSAIERRMADIEGREGGLSLTDARRLIHGAGIGTQESDRTGELRTGNSTKDRVHSRGINETTARAEVARLRSMLDCLLASMERIAGVLGQNKATRSYAEELLVTTRQTKDELDAHPAIGGDHGSSGRDNDSPPGEGHDHAHSGRGGAGDDAGRLGNQVGERPPEPPAALEPDRSG